MMLGILILIFIFTSLYLLYKKSVNSNSAKVRSTLKKPHDVIINELNNESKSYQKMIPTNSNNVDVNVQNIKKEIPEQLKNFQLILFKQIDNQQLKDISNIIECYRKPHPLLLPLAKGAFEPNELFDLIKTDPEMTAKILNVVNSPMFGLRQPITSINHAIIFIGVSSVKSIAMQFAINQSVAYETTKQDEAAKKIWLASYLASTFGFLLAKELGRENPAELSTYCLLSYLGDMALLSFKPELAEEYLTTSDTFTRVANVQSKLQSNSAIIGSLMAKEWLLPKTIVNAIEYTLLPLVNGMAKSNLTAAQQQDTLICYIACRLGEMAAFQNITDVSLMGKLGLDELDSIDFSYTQAQLSSLQLEKINILLNDANMLKKMNALINKGT